MKKLLFIFFFILVTAPSIAISSDSTSDTANEPTPIRYLNCDNLGNNCFVAARFKDLRSCEWHKQLSAAKCNYETPGKIVCDTTRKNYSTAFCTK